MRKFADHKERIFSRRTGDWDRHLQALGLTGLKVTPDPVLIASEGALRGRSAIRDCCRIRSSFLTTTASSASVSDK